MRAMNIFVGNLSHLMDERGLHTLFQDYGIVKSINLMKDLHTSRSRGYAFVEMFSDNEAIEAIKGLNNRTFLGKRIVVNNRENF